MISHFSYVCCDRCGGPGPLGDDAREARKLARMEGWRVRPKDRYDMCTPCAQGKMWQVECAMFVDVERPRPLPRWDGD